MLENMYVRLQLLATLSPVSARSPAYKLGGFTDVVPSPGGIPSSSLVPIKSSPRFHHSVVAMPRFGHGSGCVRARRPLRLTRADMGLWADGNMLQHDGASRIRVGRDGPALIVDAATDVINNKFVHNPAAST
jgi:hypothetical protein